MPQIWDIDLIVPATTPPATDIQRLVDGFNTLRSTWSGASEPAGADQVAYMLWADTTTGLLKIRNAANNAWVTIGTLASTNLGLLPLAGGAMTGGVNDVFTAVASATSPTIFATTVGNVINYTGTTTATSFATAPQAGCQRILVCAAAAVFTAGANMLIDGIVSGQNYTATAGDRIEVIAVTTTQFRLRVANRIGGDGLRVSGRLHTLTTTVAFSATPTFNAALGNYFEFGTLTGNVTTTTITNAIGGHEIRIRFKQDGTGSRTVAAPAGAKINGSVSAAVNVASHLTLVYSLVDARWEGSWTAMPV